MINQQSTFAKFLPYIVAIVIFAAVSAAYFAPQFSGKKLPSTDVTQYEGMSKEIKDHMQEYGEDPQWTGSMFGGMPGTLIVMQHDSMLLKPAIRVFDLLGQPMSNIFIAMLAFFVMLLLWRVNPWVAIVPSLAYGLSTYFFLIMGAGHLTKMWALAFAPLMIGSMGYTFRGNKWLGGALTAVFASIEIACNHPQITYYFLLVMIALWINQLVRAYKDKWLPKFAKITGILAFAAVLAVGSNAAMLYYISDYGKDSMRGGSELASNGTTNSKGLDIDYATGWSYGKMETFNMFIPDFTGGASDRGFSGNGEVAQALAAYNAKDMAAHLPGYWGPQAWTGGPTYIGAVIIFLCVLGLFLLKGRNKWWIVIITAIAIMLAWGRNFMWFTELFFNFFPGYNKFRTVAMILVIAQWSIPFLAALILNKIWREGVSSKELIAGVKKSVYVCGGVALFFLLFGSILFDFTWSRDASLGLPDDILSAMRSERASMLRADSLRSLIFVLLTAAAVWVFAIGKIKRQWMIAILAVLICADLIPVDMRFLPQSRMVSASQTAIKPTAADLEIMADTTLGYRVFNLTVSPFDNATTSYFHRSVGGYHGAKMQRYQEIIERYLAKNDMQVLNMLNTKYFIVPEQQTSQPQVMENPDANGAAWFVDRFTLVASPDEEITSLGRIDTRREAVVDNRFADQLKIDPSTVAPDSTATIGLVEYRANYLKYEYYTDRESVAVFSEIYYGKGWTAYIDGVEAPHFRADYILRGMLLPAGKHIVEFRYRAPNYQAVSTVTLIFSILTIVALVAAIVAAVLCRRKKEEQKEA